MLFSLLPLAGMARAQQVTNTIYSDAFGRTGALNGSTPSPVNTSNATWTGWQQLVTDGSEISVTNAVPGSGFNNAFLPLTPQAGHIYTVSVSIRGLTGGTAWLAYGFAQNALTSDYYAGGSIGAGWLLHRADNSGVQVFDGPGTADSTSFTGPGTAVTNSYMIVLDTTVGNATSGWTVAFWRNGTKLRQDTYAANPTIRYVGVGADGATGRYLNFQLTDASSSRPFFTQTPPASVTVNDGAKLTIAASVAGAPPLSCVWSNLSTVPATLIAGQTNATLVISNVSYDAYNNAQLQLTVTNPYGTTNATTLVSVNTNFTPTVILDPIGRTVTMADGGSNLVLRLNYNGCCYLDRVLVRGREVVTPDTGVCSAISVGGTWTTTRAGIATPTVNTNGNQVSVTGIAFTGGGIGVTESWNFTVNSNHIDWQITRNYLNAGTVDDTLFPGWDFTGMNVWTGAILDTGGVAWGRFLNTSTSYGEHAGGVTFFDPVNGVDLKITPTATPGAQVASRFSHQPTGYFSYVESVTTNLLATKYGLNRFNNTLDMWASFHVDPGTLQVSSTMQVLDDDAVRGRGAFVGVDGNAVRDLLDTIARYGTIDRHIMGGNGWLSGFVCLHEPFFAAMGLAIDDPAYTTNLAAALDDWRDHAEQVSGRVKSRWAYNSGDSMPGTFDTTNGFYEAQWGYLMDSQPDYVINVSEEFDLSGDTNWLQSHKESCERALNYLLARDSNTNGLVEMLTASHTLGKSSDWIDIVWASYENALVNAELYEALLLWSERETILGDPAHAATYSAAAAKIKNIFRLPTSQGGFWDSTNGWFVYWRDQDGSMHGDNLVMPVNFCAVAYGLADDSQRQIILDGMEQRMRAENLFHWPLCFLPYASGEGASTSFPDYENGDIFLSWGELGVRAYAGYAPTTAVAYVQRVLTQYQQDGLSFQRYLRNSQTGAGNDILAGNSMTIVGLYRDIYGVRPQWDRLLLDPHLTPALDGTQLSYQLRNQQYSLTVGTNRSTIAVGGFAVQSAGAFAVNATGNQLNCFPTNQDQPAFNFTRNTNTGVTVAVNAWPGTNGGAVSWNISYSSQPAALHMVIAGLKPLAPYQIQTNGVNTAAQKTDATGSLSLDYPGATTNAAAFTLVALPSINPPTLAGNSLILTGTGATPGASYSWLTSTNVAAPLALWTTNITGVVDGTGAFSNSILIAPSEQDRFFLLKLP